MTVTWKERVFTDGRMEVEKIHGATSEGCDHVLRNYIAGTGTLEKDEKLPSDLADEVHEIASN